MSCSEKFLNYSDEQLVELSGHDEKKAFKILLDRYSDTLLKKAQSFSKTPQECDDYYQEALISFYRAMKTYKKGKATFRTYFVTCVTNALISAKRIFTKSETTDEIAYDEQTEHNSLKTATSTETDPQQLVERQETIRNINEKMNTLLSDFERQTLKLYLGGNSYEKIAKRLNSTEKAVDNALQRVRRKLKHSGNTD